MRATHLYCFQVGCAWAPWAAEWAAPAPCVSCASLPWGAGSLCAMSGSLLDEVDERENRDPDDIDEVPVERGNVDVDRVSGPEAALVVDRQQCSEPDHAGGHVRAVETRQREERWAAQVRANRQAFVHEPRHL